MKTEYLFMAGEYKVSMPLVFATTNWFHTMSQTHLGINSNDELCFRNEVLKGVIHYANCQDSKLENDNLLKIIHSETPCWPNPMSLLKMLDRHEVMAQCCRAGLLTNDNVVVTSVHNVLSFQVGQDDFGLPFPDGVFVIKTGNAHRGLGKFLSNENWSDDLDLFDIVTCEPFYNGRSIRALIIGDRTFGIEITNEGSWIKNSPGADISSFNLSTDMETHARQTAKHFGLDVVGIDYILCDDGHFEFLEVNQYPGLAGLSEIEDYAKIYLRERMTEIENECLQH